MKSNDNTAAGRRRGLENETGKQLLVRVLTRVLGQLEDLVYATDYETEPRRNALRQCIGLAECYRDEAFPDKAHSAALELLDFVKNAPEDQDAFNRINSYGKLIWEVEEDFQAHLWGQVISYAFLHGPYFEEHGRDPEKFLTITAEAMDASIALLRYEQTRGAQ